MLRRKKRDDIKTETPSEESISPLAQSTVNTVTLSPDMRILYLIDSGHAHPFVVQSKNGVVIGLLDGQLSVASALPDITIPTPVGDPPDPPLDDDGPIKRISKRPLRLSTVTYRWTFIFSPDKGVLSIVGATDIDASIVGATDIDASLIGDPDNLPQIVGATDIDASLTDARERVVQPAPAGIVGATDIDASLTSRSLSSTQSFWPRCLLFSFSLKNNNIRIKKIEKELLIYL